MLSTATALIQATEDAIFDDEAMEFAKMLTHTHEEMSKDQFAKAIYLYSGIVASNAMDKATRVLLSETQIKELLATVGEMESMRDEVLNGK
jgi:hypothetical protein